MAISDGLKFKCINELFNIQLYFYVLFLKVY